MTGPRGAVRMVLGGLCLAVGVIWVGQGVGVIGGSFMTGEGIWAVIGAVTIGVGVLLVRGGRRPPPD